MPFIPSAAKHAACPIQRLLASLRMAEAAIKPRLSHHHCITARNTNNLDLDFCEYQGRLIINYSWGNQHGVEYLAEAVYEGTQEQFLRGWFP